MIHLGTVVWAGVYLALGTAVVTLVPGWGLRARWKRRVAARNRRRFEDALKHLHSLAERGQAATAESIAGALRLSPAAALELIEAMEHRALVRSVGTGLELTGEGEREAVRIIRAHRLWERYLADDAGMSLAEVHHAADRAEHQLDTERLEELDAHLGHPQRDPHGDPIPRPDGTLPVLDAVPLTDWSTGTQGYIAHVEDEPEIVLREILSHGLKPGRPIRVLAVRPDAITVTDGRREFALAPVVAANIQVQAAPVQPRRPPDAISLAEHGTGEAEVVGIDPAFRGFARRRLLDLGLTPGAVVRLELENPFGDPRAYRVRGAVIALRQDQARHIWVRPRRPPKAVSRPAEAAP